MTQSPSDDSLSMLDPEILREFVQESNGVLGELEAVVEKLEEGSAGFPAQLLEEFSQKIDRIMGAAKTMSLLAPEHPGFVAIGKIAELCKSLGYKAAEKQVPQLIPIFAAFWADTIEVMGNLMNALGDVERSKQVTQSFSLVLQKRLEWLLGRLAPQRSHEEKAQEIREMLKGLGL